jgi:hypothetical protein
MVESVESEDVVFHGTPKSPSPSGIDALLASAMDAYEKGGISAAQALPAQVFLKAKAKSDASAPKGWESFLGDAKAGDVTGKAAVGAMAQAIVVTRQGSLKLRQDGVVSLSVSASKDVTFPEEAARQIAGKLLSDVGYSTL